MAKNPERGPLTKEYSDVHTSTVEYASRFQGEIGHWFLEKQRNAIELLLGESTGSVLDVAGGHAQVAPYLASRFSVTVVGSCDSALTRIRSLPDALGIRAVCGDLLDLPFDEQQFDIVICLRLMAHCRQWKKLVAELCRVSNRTVLVDYAGRRSINALNPLLFRVKKAIEGNTRAFELLSDEAVEGEFRQHGYRQVGLIRQFALPMALHRLMRCHSLSARLEELLALAGMVELAGSPVIVRFDR